MLTAALRLDRAEGEGFVDWQLLLLCASPECSWFHVTGFVPFGTRPTFMGSLQACPRCGCERYWLTSITKGGQV